MKEIKKDICEVCKEKEGVLLEIDPQLVKWIAILFNVMPPRLGYIGGDCFICNSCNVAIHIREQRSKRESERRQYLWELEREKQKEDYK